MKHILGLSDAVDQAMSNFNLKVRFPCTKVFPIVSTMNPTRVRTYSKVSHRSGYSQLRVLGVGKSSTTARRRFDLILHYLRVFPKGLPEKDYVKIIKLSLAGSFSFQMDQELPEGYGKQSIPLFPLFTQRKLDAALRSKKKRVQFYFNLLQSKALCAPVDEGMISEAYDKHHASLCRPVEDTIPCDPELYRKLKIHAKNFFRTNCSYDPYKTSVPNSMASIEANRQKGGNREALKNSGTLQRYSHHPLLQMMDDVENPRMEPFVIGLFGEPGSGKSTLVQRLLTELRRYICPSFSREEFCYSRSCNTNHWDGYIGQPIVVLDDFGQSLEDRSDLSEFMTLISTNDYVLPMADLREKGKKFRSPIVIVTSNMAFGTPFCRNPSQGQVLEDTLALWRRFDLPLLVSRTRPGKFPDVRKYSLNESGIRKRFYDQKHRPNGGEWNFSTCYHISGNGPPEKTNECRFIGFPYSSFGDLVQEVKQSSHRKFDFHQRTFHDSWTQVVHSYKVDYRKFTAGPFWDPFIEQVNPSYNEFGDTICLDFPINPPPHSPVVKAHAIAEPLKVRMITVAECDTKVLQPLQKSLWTGLARCPQFCLTNGVKDLEDFELETLPWIYRIEKVIQKIRKNGFLKDSPLWLSGDYTAATDNFPMWATEALVEGILEEIDHEPTRQWVRWEISPHRIDYPKAKRGTQTSGQLMGSLLSFPLLCLLNDFVMQESGFDSESYLVNGDDVVAFDTIEKINSWRSLAPRVGLSLSVGKNFIDPEFCTVNSQLFFNGDVLHTGKVSTQKRTGTTISYCFAEAQFYWGSTPELKENFLTRNWKELSQTPRSLHYSKDHGGLGLCDTQTAHGISLDQRLAKEVYLYDCLSRFSKIHRVEGAPFSFVCFPVLKGDYCREKEPRHSSQIIFERFQSLGALSAPLEEKFDDLSHRKFREWRDRFTQNLPQRSRDLWNHLVKDGQHNLEKAPRSSFLSTHYLAITNGLARRYADYSAQTALNLLGKIWVEGCDSVHPLEYLDHEDHEPLEILDDYEQEALDIVQLFSEGPEVDSEGCVIKEDVIKFWDSVSPSTLESLGGGQYFHPRPQGFEALDEFLNFFDQDDTVEIDNCPLDDHGFDETNEE
nr:MAG: putative RNA-dependent RNA polymerase [Narnaviridae sp.]